MIDFYNKPNDFLKTQRRFTLFAFVKMASIIVSDLKGNFDMIFGRFTVQYRD